MTRPERSEIWLARLDPTLGDEIGKTRPCVVISGPHAGRLQLVIVVPVTEWKPAYQGFEWFSRLEPDPENGLTKTSGADAFQVKSISILRCRQKLGQLSAGDLEEILAAVAWSIGY